jgi:hypothetical protein
MPKDDVQTRALERLVESAVRLSDETLKDNRVPADVRDLRRYVEDARYVGLIR